MWIIIPVMALSIPIVGIIAGGPIGKALAESIRDRHTTSPSERAEIKRLEKRVSDLESALSDMSSDIRSLEDKNDFFSRLLEDDSRQTR